MPGENVLSSASRGDRRQGPVHRNGIRAALLSATALGGLACAPSVWADCLSSIDSAQTWNSGSHASCGDLAVGDAATGSFVISNGATFANGAGYVGKQNGSDGTVTVTGAGSTWTNTVILRVGYSGTGRLTISNGGTVSSPWGYVGYDGGTTGTVTITGAGSSWTGISQLHVGRNGFGTLTVSDGGAVTVSGVVVLAQFAGSTGTLNIGSAAGEAATAAGVVNAGTVTGNGTIVFNHTDTDYVFSPNIDAGGSVKVYSGTTTLTGATVYNGATTVYGGRLLINGNMATSASTVKNGGTLGGTGTFRAVTVESGGMFAPGDSTETDSLGTASVNGAFTMNAGGILEIEVSDPSPIAGAPVTADKVDVSGTVDVSGGTLRVVGLTGDFDDDQYVHVIIDNDGADAVVGTFNTVDNRLAFYEATVSYAGNDGNDVVLTLDRNANAFVDVAETPNQQAVAAQLSALPGSDGDAVRTSIQGLTTAAAQHAYKQLSGDIYATNQLLNVQTSQQVRQQVVGRLGALRAAGATTARKGMSLSAGRIAGFAPSDSAIPGRTSAWNFSPVFTDSATGAEAGVWVQAVGGKGRFDGNGNAVTVDYDWRGVMTGYDADLSEDLRLGVFFGYVDGENTQTEVSTRIESNTLLAGIYGAYGLGDWQLSAQAGWSRIDSDSRRELSFGNIDRVALADYTDYVVALEAELARDFALTGNAWVEPYVGITLEEEFLEGFTERDAGSTSLTRAKGRRLTGSGTLGLRVSGLWDSGHGWRLVPQAGIAWRRHIGPTDNSVTFNYVGSDPFTVSGTAADDNALVGSLGVSRVSDSGWQAYADYRPTLSRNQREHSFVAGLRIEW